MLDFFFRVIVIRKKDGAVLKGWDKRIVGLEFDFYLKYKLGMIVE